METPHGTWVENMVVSQVVKVFCGKGHSDEDKPTLLMGLGATAKAPRQPGLYALSALPEQTLDENQPTAKHHQRILKSR